ncbi:beta/gamma crystallin-related protein [Phenylobacterium sp.]|uniref:beta/gamma crystallin-related protein n=1 Tax=Phenylobacterium sp. TaxID=1871053 RepID=UPI002DEBC4F0|nr:beta/gamma crystallin-related protein [Phenylobacterium sp.]
MRMTAMRKIWAAAALAMVTAAPALAQPAYGGPPPPGAYQRQCSNIRMEGQFLHATCRGAHGGGDSSINVLSCSTGIFVDDSGALTCIGPGGGAPPQVSNGPPGYNTGQGQGYDRGHAAPAYGDRGYRDRRGGGQQMTASLFGQRSWRGQPVQIWGPTPDLAGSGLNDRVRSIQIDRRAGPWLVCQDAGYRGRCVTIRDSVSDTRSLGIDGISSLRPLG